MPSREELAEMLKAVPPPGSTACTGKTGECFLCGSPLVLAVATCTKCGANRSHRDCYPDQYEHPLCGVRVVHDDKVRMIWTVRIMNEIYVVTFFDSTGTERSIPLSELTLAPPEVP